MFGLIADGAGFEVLAGNERVGSRRVIGPADVELLTGSGGPVCAGGAGAARMPACSMVLGRELFGWLDGDQGQLTALLDRAARPVVFEVRGAAVAVGGGVGGAAGAVGAAGPAGGRVPGGGRAGPVLRGAAPGRGGRAAGAGWVPAGAGVHGVVAAGPAGAGLRGRGSGDPGCGRGEPHRPGGRRHR